MRRMNPLVFLLFFGILIFPAEGQEISAVFDSVNGNLPRTSLRTKYRIRIKEATTLQLEQVQKEAQQFSRKFRRTAYIVRNCNAVQLQTGDYSEKKVAKQSLPYLKKNFPGAGIVKSSNDSVTGFVVYVKRKPARFKQANDTAVKVVITPSPEPVKDPPRTGSGWNDQKYLAANTANDAAYLAENEKKVIYYLNLVRMNPGLFADTYLADLKNSKDFYEGGLYRELKKLSPMPVLSPDQTLFASAKCHAAESGKSGYVGHKRTKCKENFRGECISYGEPDPLGIVRRLLIDQGIKSLGHRRIMLDAQYSLLGVSIQPHKTYSVNTVLDFR
jgi:hypothetical protein